MTAPGGPLRSLADLQAELLAKARRDARNARRRERRAEQGAVRRRRATRPAGDTAPRQEPQTAPSSVAVDAWPTVRQVRVLRAVGSVLLDVAADGSAVCPTCADRLLI